MTRPAPSPDEIARAEVRSRARARGDFVEADAIRDELAASGWAVIDDPGGSWRLEPVEPVVSVGIRAADVASVLGEPATHDVSVHWVLEGWPDDVARGIASFRAHQGGARLRHVVIDATGSSSAALHAHDVEVVTLEPGTGWAAAANAGLRRACGRIVLVIDGSVEATGDVIGPLERALADPKLGLAGPFGIVTHDLREFEPAAGPGPCDAIEGYGIAMRREVLAELGGFDEGFRWYRTADVELSFRAKARGLRTDVVPLPVRRHEHRMWNGTSPADRARWSKRNFNRFLDLWRDRWDLVLDPRPPGKPDEP